MKTTRLGIMGFGRIGRQIYKLALQDEQFDVVAISDIGQPQILCHLLNKTLEDAEAHLDSNYLVCGSSKSRLIPADRPTEIPWDVFGVDVVIDATGQFRSKTELTPHINNGAKRVVLSVLPEGEIDRVILRGVNDSDALRMDQVVSAGSASTTATALALKIIGDKFGLEHASMTSIHAYTSDQSLQDYAGPDYRRSRSGAENIIPNVTPALEWVQRIYQPVEGKMTAFALNVPVQVGSMVDITVSLSEDIESAEDLKQLFIQAEADHPGLIATTDDPIVSSDVKGTTSSLLVDLKGSMQAGKRLFKLLAWHETLCHAKRILEVAALYSQLDEKEQAA